jgi:hypothetical protein
MARFCGVCGTTMSQGAAPVAPPTGPTAQYPAHGFDPPARRASSAPPMPAHVPGAGFPAAAGYPPGVGQALQPAVYTVPAINLVGAGQIGAAISAVFNLIPCLLFAWGVTRLVNGVRWVLDSWTAASIRIPIPIASVDVPVNYIDLFRLRSLYDFIIYWDDRLWLAFILLFLIPWLLSIVLGALFGGIFAAVYNAVGKASGGMRVTLVSTPGGSLGQPASPASWSSGPPPGPMAGSPPAWPSQGWPAEPRR